ncbi:MAG: SDR family NAD(P)-dependent oxidoreductase [Pseudomonadota bacterium]
MTVQKRFADKVAVVTGGGSGLGQRIAMDLAEEGAVLAIPDVRLEAAKATVEFIRAAGGQAIALQTDVSQGQDVRSMAQAVVRELGGIDILVNNAGIVMRAPLLDLPEEEWDQELAIDLKGVYLCIKQTVPHMVARGGGKIVNISSVAGMLGFVAPAYTAAKGGLIALTKVLVGELSPHKININTVCPGFCATPLNETVRMSEAGQVLKGKIPWGRYGTPEDVSASVRFLASQDADYITGAILPVDGGLASFVDLGSGYRTFDKQ